MKGRSAACFRWSLALVGVVAAAWLVVARVAPPPAIVPPTSSAYAVQGIDVSRHQGDIDWRAVAGSGVKFAWIKATEGGDHLDAKFRRNWTLAWASGVRRGAYHFVYWCRRAEEQAAWFVANVPADPDALPPVLDVEWTPQSRSCPHKVRRDVALADMKVMLRAMEKAYGRKPVIYAPLDFFSDIMQGELRDYPLWVRNIESEPAVGYGDRPWIVWQHSDRGRVPGVRGGVDLDAFRWSKRSEPTRGGSMGSGMGSGAEAGGSETSWTRWLSENAS